MAPKKRKTTYTTGDVARLLGVAPRTACKMLDSGEVPGAFRVGTDRRIAHAYLRDYLASQPGLLFALDQFDALEGDEPKETPDDGEGDGEAGPAE